MPRSYLLGCSPAFLFLFFGFSYLTYRGAGKEVVGFLSYSWSLVLSCF